MKRILTIILLVFNLLSFSQNKDILDEKFEKQASELSKEIKSNYSVGRYDTLKRLYLQLRTDLFGQVDYPNTLKWLAYNYYENKNFAEAKYYFKEMYKNDFSVVRSRERLSMSFYPAYNFKGISAFYLSEIYLVEKQYDSCLFFLNNARYVAPDNSMQIDEEREWLHLAMIKSLCYEAQDKIDAAISILIPFILCECLDRTKIDLFFTQEDLIDRIVLLLLKKYNSAELENELKKSLDLLIDNSQFMIFFDYKIPIKGSFTSCINAKFITADKETLENYIKKRKFYIKLNSE